MKTNYSYNWFAFSKNYDQTPGLILHQLPAIDFTFHRVAYAFTPNLLHPLAFLRSGTTLTICLCSGMPISTLTHPHASAPLPLDMLMLPLHPQDILLMLAPHPRRLKSLSSFSALPTCL
ncbi:hypothetical protein O181_009370 [Austropuccinia psidii MF-1]|uniref:Uncharacterized protein n=1 Tax=Austropuccinia psidii MF-1 TaxID=1389203 RepID=A0A9Q3BR67_9BASI|nr:hypothetical protein [Austropuccinia psidii MF-1]